MRHSLVAILLATFLTAPGIARADIVSIESVYYVADAGLRSVAFDGSSFLGGFQQHEVVDPNWTAMSLIVKSTPGDGNGQVPEPATLPLFGLALAGFLAREVRSAGM